MRTLITSLFVAIIVTSSGQTIDVYRNGTVHQHRVKAASDNGIYTDSGWIQNDQIDSIQIVQEGSYSKLLKERYHLQGQKKDVDPIIEASSPVSPVIQVTKPPVQILQLPDYARFTAQRTTGKVLQFLGVAALTATSYLAVHNASNPEDQVKIPMGLPLAAFSVMGVGLVIDLDANRHLYLRR